MEFIIESSPEFFVPTPGKPLVVNGIRLCNEVVYRKRRQQPTATGREADRYEAMYESCVALCEPVPLKPFPGDVIERLADLRKQFPNGAEFIDTIIGQVALQKHSGLPYARVGNAMLLGEPGCGKTALSRMVARIVAPHTEYLNLGFYQEAFSLSGLDMGYSSGGPGLIVKGFIAAGCGNPLFLLDEFEKAATTGSHRVSAYVPLFQLLERETAINFLDIALNVPLNASYASWLATANNTDGIDEALLSRFTVIAMNSPAKEDMAEIVASLWFGLLREEGWGEAFERVLSTEVVALLVDRSPRLIRSLLLDAAGRAALRHGAGSLDGKVTLLAQDIRMPKAAPERPFGFLPRE